MRFKWTISLAVTFCTWGFGIGAYLYIANVLPTDLPKTSTLVVDTKKEDSRKQEQNIELKDILQQVQKAVVMIDVPETGNAGSGFLYNDKGDIITNAHVVAGAKTVNVKLSDSHELSGQIIGIGIDQDIAVLRVPDLAGEKPLPIEREEKLDLGDKVIALGSPLGFQNTVTSGIISGINRNFEIGAYHYKDVYQISAPIAPGNSGGPLINEATGNVIGINSAGADIGTIGFSIPIKNVLSIIENWSENPMTSLPETEFPFNFYDGIIKEDIEEKAVNIVTDFYHSINNGEYVTAYSLLGSTLKATTDYLDFRNEYVNLQEFIIDDITMTSNDDEMIVITLLSAKEHIEGDPKTRKYKATHQLGYENAQLKILSKIQEKIEP